MQPLCNIWRFIRNYNRIIMQVMIPFLRIHLKKNEKQLSRRYLQTHTNVSRLKEAESCILFAFPVAAPKPDKRSLETEGFVLTLSLWVGRAGQGEWLWVWWQGCGAAATLCLQFWRGMVLQSTSFLLIPLLLDLDTQPTYTVKPPWSYALEMRPGDSPWRYALETCPQDTPGRFATETPPGNMPWRHPEVCLSGDSKI